MGFYFFKGLLISFIEFLNNGGLDVRFLMMFIVWIKFESFLGFFFIYIFNNKDGVCVWFVSFDKFMVKFEIRDICLLFYVIESGKIWLWFWNYIVVFYDNFVEVMKLWIDGREVKSFKVGKFEIVM